ncbi:hypothetical protein SNL152K_8040 [Streptomyces sp. NL15-2K]|nr:hypothetical protein SNL152K_8040 [Streptomyces sp. NL15-2K]
MDMNVRGPRRDGLGRGVGHRLRRERHHRAVGGPSGPVETHLHHASMVPATTDNGPWRRTNDGLRRRTDNGPRPGTNNGPRPGTNPRPGPNKGPRSNRGCGIPDAPPPFAVP